MTPTKLLGLRVTRSGVPGKNTPHSFVAWAGFTEDSRESHAAFIRDAIHCPEWDGELTLEPVESDVVVTEPGRYLSSNGMVIEVEHVNGTIWRGYWLKKTFMGKEKRNGFVCGSVNGEHGEIDYGRILTMTRC